MSNGIIENPDKVADAYCYKYLRTNKDGTMIYEFGTDGVFSLPFLTEVTVRNQIDADKILEMLEWVATEQSSYYERSGYNKGFDKGKSVGYKEGCDRADYLAHRDVIDW